MRLGVDESRKRSAWRSRCRGGFHTLPRALTDSWHWREGMKPSPTLPGRACRRINGSRRIIGLEFVALARFIGLRGLSAGVYARVALLHGRSMASRLAWS